MPDSHRANVRLRRNYSRRKRTIALKRSYNLHKRTNTIHMLGKNAVRNAPCSFSEGKFYLTGNGFMCRSGYPFLAQIAEINVTKVS